MKILENMLSDPKKIKFEVKTSKLSRKALNV